MAEASNSSHEARILHPVMEVVEEDGLPSLKQPVVSPLPPPPLTQFSPGNGIRPSSLLLRWNGYQRMPESATNDFVDPDANLEQPSPPLQYPMETYGVQDSTNSVKRLPIPRVPVGSKGSSPATPRSTDQFLGTPISSATSSPQAGNQPGNRISPEMEMLPWSAPVSPQYIKTEDNKNPMAGALWDAPSSHQQQGITDSARNLYSSNPLNTRMMNEESSRQQYDARADMNNVNNRAYSLDNHGYRDDVKALNGFNNMHSTYHDLLSRFRQIHVV
jgi:hypothetical protein